ncbi:putative lipid-binding transport protein (Tim44 family) [Hyphomicrobiales bacterium]|nr:putative lipid-binding transport protein (Tim44 family) [Hyphomicrobiales bacterium]CAH1681486.1 putative lipid-binding transport protein (Tim44 family) [Hyphomicrobiales bacterium]
MLRTLGRRGGFVAIATLALMVTASVAEARAGRSGGMGSRGSRTYSAPPPTATAPTQAAPLQRSTTQPSAAQPNAAQPGMAARPATPPRSGLFGGGFGTALMGGLLGAGLFGLLSGSGLFGGLSGLGSILGLLLQVGLIVGLVMLAMRFFRRRQEPAMAGAGPMGNGMNRSALGGGLGGLGGGLGGLGKGLGGGLGGAPAPAAPATPVDELDIQPSDFEAFERTLIDVQAAYSNEDLNALRRLATPEVVAFMAEDLASTAAEGHINRLSDVKLLQGDLAEAWREGDVEYATVAMRFSLIDTPLDRETNKIVAGHAELPSEATELWTFRRSKGGKWMLSAIQQG